MMGSRKNAINTVPKAQNAQEIVILYRISIGVMAMIRIPEASVTTPGKTGNKQAGDNLLAGCLAVSEVI